MLCNIRFVSFFLLDENLITTQFLMKQMMCQQNYKMFCQRNKPRTELCKCLCFMYTVCVIRCNWNGDAEKYLRVCVSVSLCGLSNLTAQLIVSLVVWLRIVVPSRAYINCDYYSLPCTQLQNHGTISVLVEWCCLFKILSSIGFPIGIRTDYTSIGWQPFLGPQNSLVVGSRFDPFWSTWRNGYPRQKIPKLIPNRHT